MSVPTSNVPTIQAPANARIAAQEVQITELVKKTRDFERTIRELQQAVASEKERGLEAVKEIRDKWRIETQQWQDGYEYVQARHRLATLDIRLALEDERGHLLENKELLIQEKTLRLAKEHELTCLRRSQSKLSFQIDALEDEVNAQREELARILVQHETEVSDLKTRLDRAESARQEQIQEIKTLMEDKHKNEVEISELKSSTRSSSKQVDRLSLQVDSLRTQNAALDTRNKELQHQIDKWQSLEGRGERELEEYRKRRIELEVRIKELESEKEKDARGLLKKIAKLEAALLEAQEQVEETVQELALARAEEMGSVKDAAKWEREVERLKTILETERVRIIEFQKRENQRSKLAKTIPDLGDSSPSEHEKLPAGEVEELEEPVPEKEVRSDRANEPGDVESSDPEDTAQPAPKRTDPKPRMKRKAKATTQNNIDSEHTKKRSKVVPASQKQGETDLEDEQPAKEKRRKINVKGVFANPPGFSFAQTGDGGLDIPSVLSPVKEGQQVPPRFGTLGSMLQF